MIDAILLIAIPACYFIALALMPRMRKNITTPKFKPLEVGENGTYDPAMDEHRKMTGEVESYFD